MRAYCDRAGEGCDESVLNLAPQAGATPDEAQHDRGEERHPEDLATVAG